MKSTRILAEIEVVDGLCLASIRKEGEEKALELRADTAELLKLLAEITPTKVDDQIAPFLSILKSRLDVEKKTKVLKE